MQKKNIEKMLVRELALLNEQIDEKIIKGMSYAREARRHKFLVNSLDNIRRSRQSWIMRAIRPLSFA
jgi:hypothetical protein